MCKYIYKEDNQSNILYFTKLVIGQLTEVYKYY